MTILLCCMCIYFKNFYFRFITKQRKKKKTNESIEKKKKKKNTEKYRNKSFPLNRNFVAKFYFDFVICIQTAHTGYFFKMKLVISVMSSFKTIMMPCFTLLCFFDNCDNDVLWYLSMSKVQYQCPCILLSLSFWEGRCEGYFILLT